MSEVKRLSPVGKITGWEESEFGEYVYSEDYNDLEAENKALKAELDALRSRVVVVPDEREAFQQWAEKNCAPSEEPLCWDTWQARARLNGKTVIESTLRQIALALNCLTSYDFHGTITHNFGENWADRVNGMRDELNALFCEGKEVES